VEKIMRSFNGLGSIAREIFAVGSVPSADFFADRTLRPYVDKADATGFNLAAGG
jgi:hypothetical protein